MNQTSASTLLLRYFVVLHSHMDLENPQREASCSAIETPTLSWDFVHRLSLKPGTRLKATERKIYQLSREKNVVKEQEIRNIGTAFFPVSVIICGQKGRGMCGRGYYTFSSMRGRSDGRGRLLLSFSTPAVLSGDLPAVPLTMEGSNDQACFLVSLLKK